MGKLLDLKFELDHRLLGVVNAARSARAALTLSKSQRDQLSRTQHTWGNRSSGKCLVCGNGPSVNELDFTKFAGTQSFAVNYFFDHPRGADLSPAFYVLIDGKVVSGIWPITLIDQIFEAYPGTNLFMDVRWLDLPILAPYRTRENLFWILPLFLPNANLTPRRRLDAPICGLNVVVSAIGIASAMGFTHIGIAGVDGDGLFRQIIDVQSHFIPTEKDYSMRNFESIVKSLMLSTEALWAWAGMTKTHAREGIQFANLCKGGMMDCMPRVEPDSWLQGE